MAVNERNVSTSWPLWKPGRPQSHGKSTSMGRVRPKMVVNPKIAAYDRGILLQPPLTEEPVRPEVRMEWELPRPIGPANYPASWDSCVRTDIERNGRVIAGLSPNDKGYVDSNPEPRVNRYRIIRVGVGVDTPNENPVVEFVDLTPPDAVPGPTPGPGPEPTPLPPLPPDVEPAPPEFSIDAVIGDFVDGTATVNLSGSYTGTSTYRWYRDGSLIGAASSQFHEDVGVPPGTYTYSAECDPADFPGVTLQASVTVVITDEGYCEATLDATPQADGTILLVAGLACLDSDGSAVDPPAPITGYTFTRNGTSIGTNTTGRLSDSPGPGDHVYTVTISPGGYEASASASIAQTGGRVVFVSATQTGVGTVNLRWFWQPGGGAPQPTQHVLTGPGIPGGTVTLAGQTFQYEATNVPDGQHTWMISTTFDNDAVDSDSITFELGSQPQISSRYNSYQGLAARVIQAAVNVSNIAVPLGSLIVRVDDSIARFSVVSDYILVDMPDDESIRPNALQVEALIPAGAMSNVLNIPGLVQQSMRLSSGSAVRRPGSDTVDWSATFTGTPIYRESEPAMLFVDGRDSQHLIRAEPGTYSGEIIPQNEGVIEIGISALVSAVWTIQVT